MTRYARAREVSSSDTEPWQARAACVGRWYLFHQPDGKESDAERRARISEAKALCAGCPVRIQCATELFDDAWAIVAGTTVEEREARGIPVKPRPTRDLCERCNLRRIAGPNRSGSRYCADCAEVARLASKAASDRRRAPAYPTNASRSVA